MMNLSRPAWLLLGISVVIGLILRLIVWHWHTFYPLGGDEREYLAQALTLLREHRYEEMLLMRPPLYGIFLAVCIWFGDSLVNRLRLVQAIISGATIIPMWLLTIEIIRILPPRSPSLPTHRPPAQYAPVIAAMLCALSYTLHDYATELLTETLFLFGQTTAFWLLIRAGVPGKRGGSAIIAGVLVGLLCLLRSVALPLLPLGMLWLFLARGTHDDNHRVSGHRHTGWWFPALLYIGCGLMVILPWTVRNILTYGGVIIVDTTGAENLWLDNDPAGRESVKAKLYALGEDRLTRQRIAMQEGLEVIREHPFPAAEKVWGELREFFALEYADDMRARPVIWVPPAEVWMRLVMGDGLFLLLLLYGSSRLLHPYPPGPSRYASWFMIAWGGYTLLTSLVFHVEFRYRLPLFPALLPYAAMAMAYQFSGMMRMASRIAIKKRNTFATHEPVSPSSPRFSLRVPGWGEWPARIVPVLILTLMLLHKPYLHLAWQLAQKHYSLAHAEYALEQGDAAAAARAAHQALRSDPPSVLARLALARSHIMQDDLTIAEDLLHEAIDVLPDHPLPHVLLGDLIRRRAGWHNNTSLDAARQAFAYETATLQDLQQWAWEWHTTPPPDALDIGNGLDLGMIHGFHATDKSTSWRWTTKEAWIRLARPSGPSILSLVLASGRKAEISPPHITIAIDEEILLEEYQLESTWQAIHIPFNPNNPDEQDGIGTPLPLLIEIHSDVFRPRDYDRTSNDGRFLGIMVDIVHIEGEASR